MLKTFEPSTLHTAMFPWPLRATSTLESASGTLVPAASTVRPIKNSGIPRMHPARAAKSTIRNERRPIHRIDIANVSGKQRCHFSSRQSGIVSDIAIVSGHDTTSTHRSSAELGPSSSSSAAAAAPTRRRDESFLSHLFLTRLTVIAVISICCTCSRWLRRRIARCGFIAERNAGCSVGLRPMNARNGCTCSSAPDAARASIRAFSRSARQPTIFSLSIINAT